MLQVKSKRGSCIGNPFFFKIFVFIFVFLQIWINYTVKLRNTVKLHEKLIESLKKYWNLWDYDRRVSLLFNNSAPIYPAYLCCLLAPSASLVAVFWIGPFVRTVPTLARTWYVLMRRKDCSDKRTILEEARKNNFY